MEEFKFVDLFAGIGGFHQALKKMGGTCVAASEIDPWCKKTYSLNYPETPLLGDITKEYLKLPKFEVLCAGFPCQPFSKAGKQQGFEDKTRGNLFQYIIKILKDHPECKIVILENVKNLAQKIENWEIITKSLKEVGFHITEQPLILSPTNFEIPQFRERVFILGIKKEYLSKKISKTLEKEGIKNNYLFSEDELFKKNKFRCGTGQDILITEKIPDHCLLDQDEKDILEIWLKFKKGTNFESPGAPIWLDFFGYKLNNEEYFKKKFNHIHKKNNGNQVRTKELIEKMPEWKINYINKNRSFYLKHKDFIDSWIEETGILKKKLIYKKFEWNCDSKVKKYDETIIQFRQSGIRVKNNNYFPALVAIDNTPIIFDKKNNFLRRITPEEAAKLQSFNSDFKFINHQPVKMTYKQLGNSVNVKIVENIFCKLKKFVSENEKKDD